MTSLHTFLGVAGFDCKDVPNYSLPLPAQLVGLELEVDRDSGAAKDTVFPTAFRPEWTKKSDGSLSNGYEYVLTGPLAGEGLVNAVHKLYSADTQVFRTYTGSTHIHLNMLDGTTLEQLQALALLTYAVEGLLYYIGDNSRQWCGFANRLTGAPHAVLENLLGPEVERRGLRTALNSAGRYYGLNLAALEKYGTVEFRYFPTATSAEEMLSWVKLVQLLKKAACELGNITAVLDTLSDKAKYAEFVQTYLADYTDAVEASCPFGKVKVLANKALVIANAQRSRGGAGWNKENLATIFFKVATPAQQVVPTVNVKYIHNPTGRTYPPSAAGAMTEALSEGKDAVVMNYNGQIYYALNQLYAWEWNHVHSMDDKLLATAYLNVAAEGGSDISAQLSLLSKSGGRKPRRHGRFVAFSAVYVHDDEDYDAELEDCDHEDDEEY
jgi:hypothetical protein